MATNYSSWNNFDEEAELRTHEAKWHAENLAKNIVKSDEKLQASLSSTQASAASAASALQSKVSTETMHCYETNPNVILGRRRGSESTGHFLWSPARATIWNSVDC